jgi:uncharacterized membrane protein
MHSGRLEAFSDGVIAILITIMVLGLHMPQRTDLAALRALAPVFASYALSFVYLAIYWNNHHHLLKLTKSVDGGIMWANMHLLFWLSLVPFATGWLGENYLEPLPVAVYGISLLLAAVAWHGLQNAIIAHQGPGSRLAAALGYDLKGKLSPLLYLAGVILAFYAVWIALGLYVAVALMWLIPDRRFAAAVED